MCDGEVWKPVRTEPEGRLVRCGTCQFLYVYPRPTAEQLKALYDNEYFSLDDLASCLSFRTPVFQQCLRHLDLIAGDGRRLLDVGCGTGEFVAQALLQCWDAVGIESSRMAADFASEHNHLPVYNAVLGCAPFEAGSFDVVTLLDVLEHLLNPRQEISQVYELLKPGGIVVVRVPNTLFHLPKARVCSLLGISVSNLEMRYHLNHFTPHTLSSLLRTVGFDVLSIEVGASETTAHAAWASPRAKRWYVKTAHLMHSLTGVNFGNIMVAYARKPA